MRNLVNFDISESIMSTVILTYWPIVSIVLLLALIAVFFFAPGWAGVAASIVLILSLAMIIFSVIYRQKEDFQKRSTNRIMLARLIQRLWISCN